LKTYKNEKNLILINSLMLLTLKKPSENIFLLKANRAYISNGHFVTTDEIRKIPKDLDFTRLNASITDFLLYGPAGEYNNQ
jgi:hypothetical protein